MTTKVISTLPGAVKLNTMILKNNLQYYCIIPIREITCTNDSSTKIISSSIHIFQITLRNYFRNFEFLVENCTIFSIPRNVINFNKNYEISITSTALYKLTNVSVLTSLIPILVIWPLFTSSSRIFHMSNRSSSKVSESSSLTWQDKITESIQGNSRSESAANIKNI